MTTTLRRQAPRTTRTQPVVYWAVLGALTLAFILFVWGKWITGPYFEPVVVGPIGPPTWMKIAIRSLEVIFPVAGLYAGWRVLIRPLWRERRVTLDGQLFVICIFMWFWDPMGNYLTPTYLYNSYAVNMGSWLNDTPGYLGPGKPGAMVSEPLLNLGIYMSAIFGGMVLACWFMRKVQERWPHFGPARTLGVALLFFIVLDILVEAIIWMPAGHYHEGGFPGPSLFPNSYHKFPLIEPIWGGAWWLALTAVLRYFKNDKGETIAERGLSSLKGGPVKLGFIRFLALLAAMSVAYNVTFTIPALFMTKFQTTWPEEVQAHSYFTNGICGAGTDRMCPGPGVPIPRGNDSAYLNRQGGIGVPEGKGLPAPVPAAKSSALSPFSGSVIGITDDRRQP